MIWAPVIAGAFDLIDDLFTSDEEKEAAKLKVLKAEADGKLKEMDTQAAVIMSEANGESWLQRNWRPLTMLSFVVLIFMYWFGVVPPNVTEAVLIEVFALIKIGLGGYVLGRSAEKVAERAGHLFKK